jgi:hypothetical protein
MVLITYHFQSHQYPDHRGFHYAVAVSATDWIDAMENPRLGDGDYVLIHVLEITDEQASRYDGALQSM